MKRTISRIIAMMVLYDYDINQKLNYENIITLIDEDEDVIYNKPFITQLVYGTIENLKKIDHTLALNLQNYTLNRLNYVDRALLRLGTYEILFTDTPKNIIINEIIEISRLYSETEDTSSTKFNNSVLDKIQKEEYGK